MGYGQRNATSLILNLTQYLSAFGPNSVPIYLPNGIQIPLDAPSLGQFYLKEKGKGSLILHGKIDSNLQILCENF